ncbi:MAG: hypothetical protein ACRYFS_15515 [Janthinobacterium lividum]
MIPKQIEVSGLACRTASTQDEDDWEVSLTSIDPVLTATGYGSTEDEAFEDAKEAFKYAVEGSEQTASC